MSKTTFTFGWTFTRAMPPLSDVIESDRLMRNPRPVEFTYLTFSMSRMNRFDPRSLTALSWVWKVMTVFASMEPFRMTRLAPGIPFTSWTWMVRSGTGENLLRYDAKAA